MSGKALLHELAITYTHKYAYMHECTHTHVDILCKHTYTTHIRTTFKQRMLATCVVM